MNKNSLTKAERLRSKKIIEKLFNKGQTAFEHPVKMHWIPLEDNVDVRVRLLVSVSKRNIKKAVHRNKIKRRLREAYRSNKHELTASLTKSGRKIALALIYVGKDTGNFNEIERKIIKLINRLIHYNEKDFR